MTKVEEMAVRDFGFMTEEDLQRKKDEYYKNTENASTPGEAIRAFGTYTKAISRYYTERDILDRAVIDCRQKNMKTAMAKCYEKQKRTAQAVTAGCAAIGWILLLLCVAIGPSKKQQGKR